MKILDKDMRVYAITDRHWLNGRTLASQVEEALKNGATFLQLREKNASHDEIVALAKEIKKIASKYNVPFVIDDDIYAAVEADADGVHIGQNDMDYLKAREILGPDKIIGMTAPSVELARQAEALGADYIGAGAVFSTDTKKDTKPLSLQTLREITGSVSIPVVAIGGINHDNVLQLKNTGISGIAVVSAIFGQPDISSATRNLLSLVKQITAKNLYIFDMDGTIIDSMGMWMHVGSDFFKLNGHIPPENIDENIETKTLPQAAEFFASFEIGFTPKEVENWILDYVVSRYENDLEIKPGMYDLLKRISEDDTNILCLLTASEKKCVIPAFDRLNITNFFDKIYTCSELGMTKETPDVFNFLCDKFNIKPENTFVYEDALYSIKAAKKAGCKVTAVPDIYSSKHETEISALADAIYDFS